MSGVSVRVTTHWVNGWFLKPLAKPYVVVNGRERRVRWGREVAIELVSVNAKIGVGVRYFGRGALLGCEPQDIDLRSTSSNDVQSNMVLEFRNGPLNHMPFRIANRSRIALGEEGHQS